MTERRASPRPTPTPWVVREGGNYVYIGAEGYGDYVRRTSYLAGPLGVAEMNHAQSENHAATHDQAVVNARLIVEAVNHYAALRQALTEVLAVFRDVSSLTGKREVWESARALLATLETP